MSRTIRNKYRNMSAKYAPKRNAGPHVSNKVRNKKEFLKEFYTLEREEEQENNNIISDIGGT
jgi:hypothetical protein